MTVKEMEANTKKLSTATGRKAGSMFYIVWNIFMDLIYLLAIVTVVSVIIYVAYTNGVDHPAIQWAGSKVNNVWLGICHYFKIGG